MTNNSSLKVTIVKWLAAFALVPLLLFVFVEAYLTSNELSLRANERLHNSLNLKKQFIENWFDYRKMDLISQAADPNIIEFMQALNADVSAGQPNSSLLDYVNSNRWQQLAKAHSSELSQFMHDYDYVYDVFLIRPNGDIIFTLAQEEDLGTNLVTGPFAKTLFASAFEQAKRDNRFSFSGIESYRPSFGVKAGFVITPLLDTHNQTIGFFAAQLRLEKILTILRYGSTTIDAQEYLVSDDGTVLSEHGFGSIVKKDLAQIPEFSFTQAYVYQNEQGRSVFAIKEPITVLGIEWFLVGEISKDVVLASVYSSVLRSFVILVVVGVAALWGSGLVARRVTKPIENIIEFTNQHNFNLSHYVQSANGNELVLLEEMLKQTITARLEYEKVLEQYQGKMELACDSANIALFEFYQLNRQLMWDKRGFDLFHINAQHKDELYALWLQSIAPSDRVLVEQHIEAAIANKTDLDIEYRLCGEGIQVVKSQARYQAIAHDQGYWLGVHIDVSSLKQTEMTLRESQRFQSLLLANIPDIFFVKDDTFKIVQANEVFLNLYPESMRDKVIGFTTLENYSLDEREAFLEQDIKAFKEGYSEVEESILFPDGVRRVLLTKKTRFTDQYGTPYLLGLARDITYLKSQQQALFVTSERYRLAMLVSDSGIWDWDIAANRVYLSERLKVWLGQVKNEIAGSIIDVLSPYASGNDKQLIKEQLAQPESDQHIKFQFSLILSDKQTHFLLSALTLCDEHQNVVRVIGNLTDISSFKRQQTLLEQAKTEAEHASQLKSGFLATISHEIRTPLNGVLGTLQLIENTKLSHEQTHYISLCRSSAQSLGQLLNQVLDFEKLGQNKLVLTKRQFDLYELVEEVCFNHAQTAMNKGVSFYLDDSRVSTHVIEADPIRLKQVMHNLVQNAVKFTENGAVSVVVKTKQVATGCVLILHVNDTGIGIDAAQKTHIFNEFTQLDNSASRDFEGSGLGLSIVAKLVALMGGKIKVTSKLQVGSCFSVRIPITGSNLYQEQLYAVPLCVFIAPKKQQNQVVYQHLVRFTNDVKWVSSIADLISSPILNNDFSLVIDSDLLNNEMYPLVEKSATTWVLGNANAHHVTEKMVVLPLPVSGAMLKREFSLLQSHSEALVDTSQHDVAQKLQHCTVAVAEDNPVNQVITKTVLQKHNVKFVLANNGKELIEILASGETKVDLILMDCQMPVMDGFAATKAIREGAASEDYINIPIIALTANAMEGDKNRCLAAGMSDYLAKPIEQDKLIKMLHQYFS